MAVDKARTAYYIADDEAAGASCETEVTVTFPADRSEKNLADEIVIQCPCCATPHAFELFDTDTYDHSEV